MIIRANTHAVAMKALKMRDSDLINVLNGYKSDNGKISSFDIASISNLTHCQHNVPQYANSNLGFGDIKKQESLMSATEIDGRIIVTVTDEQADKLMSKDVAVLMATLKVGFDKACSVTTRMVPDDHLSFERQHLEKLISKLLKLISPDKS